MAGIERIIKPNNNVINKCVFNVWFDIKQLQRRRTNQLRHAVPQMKTLKLDVTKVVITLQNYN